LFRRFSNQGNRLRRATRDAKAAADTSIFNDLIASFGFPDRFYLAALIRANAAGHTFFRVDPGKIVRVHRSRRRDPKFINGLQRTAAAPAAITYKIVSALIIRGHMNESGLFLSAQHVIGFGLGDDLPGR